MYQSDRAHWRADAIVDDVLMPTASCECYGCSKRIPGGTTIKLVPVKWVTGLDGGSGRFSFCGACSMPDGPPAEVANG